MRDGDDAVGRLLPRATPAGAAYWAAASAGRLALPACAACARAWHPREDRCPACRAPVAYADVSDTGTVHSYTVVHRPFVPEFAGAEPYPVANVTVDGTDVRLLGHVVGVAAAELHIGARVRTVFVDVPGFGAMPAWRLDDEPVRGL